MSGASRPPDDLQGLRVLVVEDTMLVADVIVEQLQDCGCEVVGPAARVNRALELARREKLDGALLDVNLAGEYCFPIAQVLASRGIPFAFLTGYGDSAIPPEYRDVQRLQKPFELKDLVRIVGTTFAGGR